MPVVALAKDGKLLSFLIRNVRCIPEFKYTLLSVNQLWREQRVDSRFADVQSLVLPPSKGGAQHFLPFLSDRRLPTVRLMSAVGLGASPRVDSSDLALVGESPAPLGFQRPFLVEY